MDIKNIDKAKELIPQLEDLGKAKKMLADSTTDVFLHNDDDVTLLLPNGVKMNILNVVNCEYERIRKEVSEL